MAVLRRAAITSGDTTDADLRAVLIEGHIVHPGGAVLDLLLATGQSKQVGSVGVRTG